MKLGRNGRIIIIMLLVIIILLIATSILKRNLNSTYQKYSDIDSAEEFISNSKISYDRQKFWEINDILDNVLNNVVVEYHNKNFNCGEKYNGIIDDKYARKNKREDVVKLLESFFNAFIIENETPPGIYYKTDLKLEKMYNRGDQYLCLLNTNTGIEDFDEQWYIGIKLNEGDLTFSIFYLEKKE